MIGAILALIGFLSAAPAFDQEGRLQALARQARAEKQPGIKVSDMNHNDVVGESLEYYLRHHSLAFVTASDLLMTSASPDTVFSWQRVVLDRMLWRAPPLSKTQDAEHRAFCASLPKPDGLVRFKRREIGVVTAGGTVTIDGVAVTIETGFSVNLTPGARYLIVGFSCGEVFYVNGGGDHLFLVDDRGNLSWAGLDKEPWVQRLLQLKTVSMIERYVLTLRQPGESR